MEDLRQHRHLVIRERGQERSRTSGWLNEQRWTVSHKATSIRAACIGLGYAWYAENVIHKEFDVGEMKPLPLREGAKRWDTLYLIFADRDVASRHVGLRFANPTYLWQAAPTTHFVLLAQAIL